MEKLIEKSCAEFSGVLASKESVPGGGGAAALVGALGAALCSMVGNFTIDKKKYEGVRDDVQRMLNQAEDIRLQLLQLVDADADAFAPLAKAYSLPKDDPEHDRKLEEATRNACEAPLNMLKQCAKAVVLLEEMAEKGSKMLISDVSCGAVLCRAALECAAMNVFINTKSLKDTDLAEKIEREVDAVLDEYIPRADSIVDKVSIHIRKER